MNYKGNITLHNKFFPFYLQSIVFILIHQYEQLSHIPIREILIAISLKIFNIFVDYFREGKLFTRNTTHKKRRKILMEIKTKTQFSATPR